jgi:hypothetical protein
METELKTQLLVILVAPLVVVHIAAVLEGLRRGSDASEGGEGVARSFACNPRLLAGSTQGGSALGLPARFTELGVGHYQSPGPWDCRSNRGWARARRRHRRRWS